MKFPILISYAYARKNLKAFEHYANMPNVDVLLDSGAFTAKNTGEDITLTEYLEFLDTWKDRIFRYLALDVVGDPQGSQTNLEEMLRRGYKPVPVHVLGDDQDWMDYLFSISDYVALAGLRRPGKGHCHPEYIKQKMTWARGRMVHWLGYVKEEMFGTFHPYSCDSRSWANGQIFGLMHPYLGGGRWQSKVLFKDRHKAMRTEVADILVKLGWTVDEFNDREMWKNLKRHGTRGSLPMSVSTDSWVRYVVDVQKRLGTRVFLAVGLSGEIEKSLLTEAINRYLPP